ncbi:MAG: hypothetical protein KDJ80_03105 [Nitratireductor sp.]|nr:hypothetical protein [Nitratireductor sp.]
MSRIAPSHSRKPHALIPVVFLSAGLVLSVSPSARAACAISVGEGKGPNQPVAAMQARLDARARAGGAVPANAEYSDPQCYVADDFANGIASYGCRVELSYCTDPVAVAPQPPAGGGGKKGEFASWKAHWEKWRKGGWASGGNSVPGGVAVGGHSRTSASIRLSGGSWQRTQSAVSCLRFSGQASGRSEMEAANLVTATLAQSVSANVGAAYNPANLQSTDPLCAATGRHVITCSQSARYCY